MANILKIVKDFNPKKALGSIFDKIDEILQVTNESAAAIAALPVQPKVYKATLTQTGTDAPVATKLVNTLSGTPVWSYVGVGEYLLTLASEFPDELKVTILGTPLGGTTLANSSTIITWNDSDSILLETYKIGAASNGICLNYTILIEVYP
jgi:hypothetical protein